MDGNEDSRGPRSGGVMTRNGLAFVGLFFQNLETHKITYRSGHNKTVLVLVLIRNSSYG